RLPMKLLVLLLSALAGGRALAVSWPMYGHDLQQSRFNAGETLIGTQNVGSLHQAWFLPTGGPVTATPIEVGGVVYVGSWDHNFYAIDAATGAVRWKVTVATPQGDSKFPGIQSSATVASGRIYFGDASHQDSPCIHGALFALDAITGQIVWRFDTVPASAIGGAVWSTPAIDAVNDLVYVDTGDCVNNASSGLSESIIALDASC